MGTKLSDCSDLLDSLLRSGITNSSVILERLREQGYDNVEHPHRRPRMNILITGAKGFVGRNLVENLRTIKDGRNKTYPELTTLPSTSPIKENSREIHTGHQTKTSPQSTATPNTKNTIEAIYEYDLDTPPEKLDD